MVCIRAVRIVRREGNHNRRRNRQDCRSHLGCAQHEERTVPQRAEDSGKREGTRVRLGSWVAGARKPDCDHAREALVPHSAKPGTDKRSKCLVDCLFFLGKTALTRASVLCCFRLTHSLTFSSACLPFSASPQIPRESRVRRDWIPRRIVSWSLTIRIHVRRHSRLPRPATL